MEAPLKTHRERGEEFLREVSNELENKGVGDDADPEKRNVVNGESEDE